ncbi:hypothetical protein PInf_026357 [Phytophthora infestans]|nr:hypothetical protein PInf_026357 [Phytophthora infestans]
MAATPPPHTTLIATSPHVSVGSQDNLDDDSEFEAVEAVDDVLVESAEEGNDCQPDGIVGDGVDDDDEDGLDDGGVSSELLVDKNSSLNTVCDGDDSAKYAAMESGDDAAKDDLVMDADSGEDDECADT